MSDAAPISDDELTGLFRGLERRPLALAVSGGADSMALMHMVARWAKREDVRAAWAEFWRHALTHQLDDVCARRTDWTGLAKPPWLEGIDTAEDLKRTGGTPHVVVLTVDHGLRAASADEARFVCEEAVKLGLPCVALRWEGEKPSTGIQEAARAARRDLMCDVLRAEQGVLDDVAHSGHFGWAVQQPRQLVMAHQQEDQAETFLMRLARGSGLEGLGGMKRSDWALRPSVAERPTAFSFPVERPLLEQPKARLVATLKAYGARWVDDPSNEDNRFERVRVRKAMPLLADLGLTPEKIALSARRLRDADMAVLRLLHAADATRARNGATAVCVEVDLVNSTDFASRYTATRALRRLLAGYGGAARPAELAQVERLAAQAIRPGSRAQIGSITLGGCKIECHGENGRWLRVFREGSGVGLPVLPIGPGQTVDWDGRRFTVAAGPDAKPGAVIRALGLQGWADLKKVVPEMAQLRWPAAAAATLPVIEWAGQILSYVGVSEGLAGESGDPAAVISAWDAFVAKHPAAYRCMFVGISDL